MAFLVNQKKLLYLILTGGLFLFLINVGLKVAQTRALWNDEIYTQLQNIQNRSFSQILTGQVSEGNNFPLFYSIQKSITELLDFRLPSNWEGRSRAEHASGQIILRIQGNIWISLTLSLTFFFFCYYSSFLTGFCLLILFLLSPIIWTYWAEARPYGLWILLTAVHCLILLKLSWSKEVSTKGWVALFIGQTLLSLTAVFGIVQSVIGTLIICLMKKSKWKVVFAQLVHLFILGIFYYSRSFHFDTWFDRPPMELIFAAVPREIFILFGVYLAYLFYLRWKGEVTVDKERHWGEFVIYAFTILLFALFLLMFLIYRDTGGPKGFQLTSRYFVFLVPTLLIAFAVCTDLLFRRFKKSLWIKTNLAVAILYIIFTVFLNQNFVHYHLMAIYINN